MIFSDLKAKVGEIITYYVVEGHKMEKKTARVEINPSGLLKLENTNKYGNQSYAYNSFVILNKYLDKSACSLNERPNSDFWANRNRKVFLNEKDAYDYTINRIRKQRQELNKKIMRLQMQCNYNMLLLESE